MKLVAMSMGAAPNYVYFLTILTLAERRQGGQIAPNTPKQLRSAQLRKRGKAKN